MSMLFELRRVARPELAKLLDDPSDIFFFLHGEEPYVPRKGLFRRIFGARTPAAPKRPWSEPPVDMRLELDQSWHLLHYAFCGCPWEGPLPQATLLGGGRALGDVDVGYGPARALDTDDLAAFLAFLETLDAADFARGLSAAELERNEIYGQPPEWTAEDAVLLWEYVAALIAFLRNASAAGDGCILYLY